MNDYSFGNFVCSLRERRGMTQAELAKRLGVTPAAISKWENGSSKPRVEVLFALAEILGVRTEELMAGHFIDAEKLDSESVKLISEKYEYLRRIELHNAPRVKFFRIFAWCIDWYILGITMLVTIFSILGLFKNGATIPTAVGVGLLILMVAFIASFVMRDMICGGRSLGKRIFGLTVLDQKTGKKPKCGSLFLRNIFLFIMQIDGLVMLVTGRTLGDRAAHTVVVRKKDLDATATLNSGEQSVESINRYAREQIEIRKSRKKNAAIWISAIVAAFVLYCVLLAGIIIVTLEAKKNTEEYNLAYEYVIQSGVLEELGMSADELKFNSYSFSARQGEDGETREAAIGFSSRGVQIVVVLHDNGEGWYVCEDCTRGN